MTGRRSCWRWEGDKTAERIPRLREGASSGSVYRPPRAHGCRQEYRTTCLLGCETDTYDSEGSQVRVAPWRHVTREQVEGALQAFRGELMQAPPM